VLESGGIAVRGKVEGRVGDGVCYMFVWEVVEVGEGDGSELENQ
jgi:hypothetical protein